MEATRLIDVARYRVIFGDCDPMRIMYYGNYFRLFEIGRVELFRRFGHVFATYMARGQYLAVIESHCRYLKPARYDDEVIIRAGLCEVGRARLKIHYAVVNTAGEVLAEGHTEHAIVDDHGRPRRVPEDLRVLGLRLGSDPGGGS